MQAQVMGTQGGLRGRILAMIAQAQQNGNKGINQTTLARASGVSREHINRICNGVSAETDDQAARILRVMAEWGYADQDEAQEADREQPTAQPMPVHKAARTIQLYETEAFRGALGWCDSIRQRREIGVMVGRPGVGKTTTLQEYANRTPGAHLITCWRVMRMGDLLHEMADAIDVTIRGNLYQRTMQLMTAIREQPETMFLIDEAPQMKKWDVDKFEQLRQIWDDTRVPIVLAGTHKLDEILRRWNGKDEVTQLSSRMSPFEYRGINEKEIRAILREYDLTADALAELVRVALDKNNGGMRNLVSVLGLCLEAAGDDRIDLGMVQQAKRHKLPI